MHCPNGNATDLIWRVLASSYGISFWTPLKPQHSNPNHNPNPLVYQLRCIDFLTTPTPLIIPHRLPAFLESLMQLKNWCSIHAIWSKAVWSIPYGSLAFFSKFKTEFYCISFFLSFRLHFWNSTTVTIRLLYGVFQLLLYSNNIVNFRESTTILKAYMEKVLKRIVVISYLHIDNKLD